jgi:hypothetical protein
VVVPHYSGEQSRMTEGNQGKIGAGLCCLPREETLESRSNGGGIGTPRGDGGGAPAAQEELR